MSLRILPESPDIFVGRSDLLTKLGHALSRRRLIFLEGVCGVGKTCTALRLANSVERENPGCVFWISCQEGWTMDSFFGELLEWLPDRMRSAYEAWEREKVPDLRERTFYILNLLNIHNACIFVDDLNFLDSDSFVEIFQILKNYSRSSKFIFITRERPELPMLDLADIHEEIVDGLEPAEGCELLESLLLNRKSVSLPSRDVLLTIMHKLEGHPLLIKALAVSLIEGLCSPESLMRELPDYLSKLCEELLKGITGILSGEEMAILKIYSLSRLPLPRDYSGNQALIERLKRCFLITCADAHVTVHALIKRFITRILDDEEKRSIHRTLADYYYSRLDNYGYKVEWVREALYHYLQADSVGKVEEMLLSYFENMYSRGYYRDLLHFIEAVPSPHGRLILMKAEILAALGKVKEAIVLYEKAEKSDIDERDLSSIYCALGTHHHNVADDEAALKYLEKAYSVCERAGYTKGIIDVLNKKALFVFTKLRIEEALSLNDRALSLSLDIQDETRSIKSMLGRCIFLIETARYIEVMELASLCETKAQSIDNRTLYAWALISKGYVYKHLGYYDDFEKCLKEFLRVSQESFDVGMEAAAHLSLSSLHHERNEMEEALCESEKACDGYFLCGYMLGGEYARLQCASLLLEMDRDEEAENTLYEIMKSASFTYSSRLGCDVRGSLACIYLKKFGREVEVISLMEENRSVLTGPGSEKKRLGDTLLSLTEALWRLGEREKTENCLHETLQISKECNDEYLKARTLYLAGHVAQKTEPQRIEHIREAQSVARKLKGYKRRLAVGFFERIDALVSEGNLIRMGTRVFSAMETEVERLRAKRRDYSLFIDIPRQEVHEREKGFIDFTRKRILASLLILLANEAGRKFTAREIFASVWECDYEGDASDLEVRNAVSRLRNLIENESTGTEYILLGRGFHKQKGGYFFNSQVDFCVINRPVGK